MGGRCYYIRVHTRLRINLWLLIYFALGRISRARRLRRVPVLLFYFILFYFFLPCTVCGTDGGEAGAALHHSVSLFSWVSWISPLLREQKNMSGV